MKAIHKLKKSVRVQTEMAGRYRRNLRKMRVYGKYRDGEASAVKEIRHHRRR